MNDEKKIEEQAAQALISNTEEIAESANGRTLSLLLLQRKRRTKTRSSVNIRLRI